MIEERTREVIVNEAERIEVAVGVDGSPSSLEAVRWAAVEAVRLGATLRIIHAWLSPYAQVPLGAMRRASTTALAVAGERLVSEASAAATLVSPGLEVDSDLIPGPPRLVLTVASHEADLLVLGYRGRGGFSGMVMGSMAASVAHRASCPVVIVRGQANRTGPVVVGIDGSAADHPVLAVAFERAEKSGRSLHAIHAWEAPEPLLPTPPWSDDAPRLEHDAREVLVLALAPFEAAYPAVRVERKLVTRSPTAALVESSEAAEIVVVGSHGAGALHGLLAGSVCHGVIYHARCPVEVVHVAEEVTKDAATPANQSGPPRADRRVRDRVNHH